MLPVASSRRAGRPHPGRAGTLDAGGPSAFAVGGRPSRPRSSSPAEDGPPPLRGERLALRRPRPASAAVRRSGAASRSPVPSSDGDPAAAAFLRRRPLPAKSSALALPPTPPPAPSPSTSVASSRNGRVSGSNYKIGCPSSARNILAVGCAPPSLALSFGRRA